MAAENTQLFPSKQNISNRNSKTKTKHIVVPALIPGTQSSAAVIS
jgi:hypothetical protein